MSLSEWYIRRPIATSLLMVGLLVLGSTAYTLLPVAAQAGGSGDGWAWGYNGFGQLGNGSTTNSSTPAAVSLPSAVFAAVAAGFDHSLAADTTGHAWAWGDNHYGQLGDGSTLADP